MSNNFNDSFNKFVIFYNAFLCRNVVTIFVYIVLIITYSFISGRSSYLILKPKWISCNNQCLVIGIIINVIQNFFIREKPQYGFFFNLQILGSFFFLIYNRQMPGFNVSSQNIKQYTNFVRIIDNRSSS